MLSLLCSHQSSRLFVEGSPPSSRNPIYRSPLQVEFRVSNLMQRLWMKS